MLTKSAPAHVKAAGGDDGLPEGVFEAIVSVFGNVDSYGDRVVKGAFDEDLKAWAASGDPIPVYWSHQTFDPNMNLGHILEAKETDQGLWVKAQLDLDNPTSLQVYRLLKGRRVTQFSFSYDILDAAQVKDGPGGESVYELRKLHVYEVGPTPIGANQETELLAVKSLRDRAVREVENAKAGRVISAKNEATLRGALTLLTDATKAVGEVLSVLDSSDDDSKATAATPVTDSTPDGAKSEPTPRATVDLSALHSIELMAITAL